MNINNPYILLRLLILIDITIMTACTYIPVFHETSVLEFFDGYNNWDGRAKAFNITWFIAHVITLISWVSLLCVRGYGRSLYAASILLFLVTSMIGGVGMYGKPLVDGAIYLSIVYSGFLVAILYFGRISQLFQIGANQSLKVSA